MLRQIEKHHKEYSWRTLHWGRGCVLVPMASNFSINSQAKRCVRILSLTTLEQFDLEPHPRNLNFQRNFAR